jgi:predicted Zn-dependent peptidase
MRALIRPSRATRRALAAAALALASSVATMPLDAQPVTKRVGPPPRAALDRTVLPTPGAAPALRVPTWTRTTLPNGAELVVVPKRDLPLVAVSVNLVGGARNFEPAGKDGLAALTAQMLSEGTTTRTGEQLADAQQLLGTTIVANVGDESGSIGFTALKPRLDSALALLADMLVNPSFPAAGLERLRGRALVGLSQAKDQPNAVATNVFARTLYGAEHPYGRFPHRGQRAGDHARRRRRLPPRLLPPGPGGDHGGRRRGAGGGARLGRAGARGVARGRRTPGVRLPVAARGGATAIYLVDKPNAAQSVFQIGLPGPARDTPDYYALEVMNTALGGLFQSRLNHDIREVKGYSYGVRSGFAFGRGPGAFAAGGGIISAKTDSALIAFMTHLRGVHGGVPFTDDEIRQAKEALVQRLPGRFASVNGTAGAVGSLFVLGLPESYYADYAAKVNAVTADDMTRVARRYIDLARLNIVVVGDRASIEAPLARTGVAPIVVLDAEGRRATASRDAGLTPA